VLEKALGNDGQLDPSHETIAEWAPCHVATVKRALVRLRDLGLVAWMRRLIRNAGTGWRAEQTSNAYVLLTPACEAQIARGTFLAKPRKKDGRAREERTPGIWSVGEAAEQAQEALARRRAEVEQQIREAALKRRQAGFAF
jgi:hypothetical protein